jgi:hypothetical protein
MALWTETWRKYNGATAQDSRAFAKLRCPGHAYRWLPKPVSYMDASPDNFLANRLRLLLHAADYWLLDVLRERLDELGFQDFVPCRKARSLSRSPIPRPTMVAAYVTRSHTPACRQDKLQS